MRCTTRPASRCPRVGEPHVGAEGVPQAGEAGEHDRQADRGELEVLPRDAHLLAVAIVRDEGHRQERRELERAPAEEEVVGEDGEVGEGI